jgi:hypothetical protein
MADDALYVDDSTTIAEIQEFLYGRAENPIVMNGKRIWNFSSYEVDRPALKDAVENKLRKDEFIIPFQVAGTWGLMYHLLPRRLKESEILVYHTRSGSYRAFNNFINRMPQRSEEEFQYQLGEAVYDGDENATDSR